MRIPDTAFEKEGTVRIIITVTRKIPSVFIDILVVLRYFVATVAVRPVDLLLL